MKRIMNALIEARERAVQRRVRQHLRGLSDRHLDDMGFSRELLEQGNEAWPWRKPEEPHGAPRLAAAMQARDADRNAQPADQNHGRHGIDTKLAA